MSHRQIETVCNFLVQHHKLPDTQNLEKAWVRGIIGNLPPTANGIHRSVFIWWITRSINEFTITLLPKTTFSILMGPKGSDSLVMIHRFLEETGRIQAFLKELMVNLEASLGQKKHSRSQKRPWPLLQRGFWLNKTKYKDVFWLFDTK